MPERPCWLLMDQGGNSSRALLVDERGSVLGEGRRPVATREAGGDRVEQDGTAILADLQASVAEAVSACPDGHGLAGAGLAVQRGSILCWDKDSGRPLSPVLSWRDRRTSAQAWPRDLPGRVRRTAGLRFSPYGGAPKLRWCLDELPAVRTAARQGRLCMGPLGAFLARGLTGSGEDFVDPTLAQRTLLFSRTLQDWDETLLTSFGLQRAQLPVLRPSRHDFGALQAAPCRLSLLMGDQNAVPLQCGETTADTVYINAGTGAFILRPLSDPLEDPESTPFQLSQLPPLSVDGPPRWALEGSIHGAASALNWFARAEGQERIPHPALTEALMTTGDRPLFINTIDGLGSPWWQPGPAPAFLYAAGSDHLQRLAAVLDSIAFLLRVNLEAMEAAGGPVRVVRLSGGLSHCDGFCQHLANLTGRPVQRLEGGEATAMGLLALLVGGGFSVPACSEFTPARDEALRTRYHVWLDHMPALE